MKLAEALSMRKELLDKISVLRQKLSDNAVYQDGSKPVEDPRELMLELHKTASELSDLIKRINKTNAASLIDGVPLGDLVVDRDTKIRIVGALKQAIETASSVGRRYSASEILLLPAINVKEVQKKTDELAKEVRELDNKIQATNWNIDLL